MNIKPVKLCIILAILSAACLSYTPYPPEQTAAIRNKEQQIWHVQSEGFSSSQTLTFVVERRIFFFINSFAFPQTVKMRGRAYFMDNRKRFLPMEQLSPFDVTKFYIYEQSTGIIVKSEQFYETFAFTLPFNSNSVYQISFEDGPPGPLKMIQWEIDYQLLPSNQPAASLSSSQMKLLQTRIKSVMKSVQQMQKIKGIPIMRQLGINKKLAEDSLMYSYYIYLEALLIITIMVVETVLLKKIIVNDTVLI